MEQPFGNSTWSLRSSATNLTAVNKPDAEHRTDGNITRRVLTVKSVFAFSLIVSSRWCIVLFTSFSALSNRGPAGFVCGYAVCMVAFGFVIASLAKLISM